MANKAIISVIMSVYNNESFLSLAIESVLDQTFREFELLITDDASTDASYQIIQDYAKLDERIVFQRNQKNIGLTKNLNKMLSLAEGNYVARMDSDDICDPKRFEKQLEVFIKYPKIDVIFTDTILIDSEGNTICKKWIPQSTHRILSLMPVYSYITHPSVMIRKETLMQYNGYNELYAVAQDWELWLRLINNNRKFYYLQDTLLYYRLHGNSVHLRRNNNKSNCIDKYELAKTCIRNNQYRSALRYWSALTGSEKILILIRIFIPSIVPRWYSYLLRRYHPYSVTKQLHQQGLIDKD